MRRVSIAFSLVAAFAAGAFLASTSANAAFDFCIAPRAPIAFLNKPSKPYCATNRSCSQWQIDSYRSDIRNYFQSLEQYAADIDKFYKKSTEYIECMAKID